MHVQASRGHFSLSAQTKLRAAPNAMGTAKWLQTALSKSTGFPMSLESNGETSKSRITFIEDAKFSTNAESYLLQVTPKEILIRAPDEGGLFYGVQSLLQLLPPSALGKEGKTNRAWTIPCVTIHDQPRFRWRGMMLDVSRHFFTKPEIERYLDALALHKINVFHWHLTDDQGWRLEIKKYPRLTEIGAWRKRIGFGLAPQSSTNYDSQGRYGGYYTQEEARDIIRYAAERHITVVPEIEMPGHASAALAAYPELSCNGGPFKTDMPAGVFDAVFCVGKEQTFTFLENVLSEVFELFPGKYVHLGGDEVPTNSWHNCAECQALRRREGLTNDIQLEGYFLRRIATFVTEHGKTPIGWSEIVNAGLPEQTVVMDWIGGTLEAVKEGHQVVRTPVEYCYFDHYQSEVREHEPRASGALLTLQQVYGFEPVPPGVPPSFILGPQANLWTEYIPSMGQMEYMTFPRLCALAEVAWSPQGSRDWADFQRRMAVHYQRLDALGINYRRPSP